MVLYGNKLLKLIHKLSLDSITAFMVRYRKEIKQVLLKFHFIFQLDRIQELKATGCNIIA